MNYLPRCMHWEGLSAPEVHIFPDTFDAQTCLLLGGAVFTKGLGIWPRNHF